MAVIPLCSRSLGKAKWYAKRYAKKEIRTTPTITDNAIDKSLILVFIVSRSFV